MGARASRYFSNQTLPHDEWPSPSERVGTPITPSQVTSNYYTLNDGYEKPVRKYGGWCRVCF